MRHCIGTKSAFFFVTFFDIVMLNKLIVNVPFAFAVMVAKRDLLHHHALSFSDGRVFTSTFDVAGIRKEVPEPFEPFFFGWLVGFYQVTPGRCDTP
jgi:hypothetical protein